MKLGFEQIKQITSGAVRFSEDKNGVYFYRFTKEQEQLYKERNQDFYRKTFATAGVKLIFKTNSKNLFLKATVDQASSRQYFSFDLFVDDKPVGYLDNFSNVELPTDYTEVKLQNGEFAKSFELGQGSKVIKLYFPWSKTVILNELSLDDGAFIEPVKMEKKALVFGDSITQGYDALRSSNRYATRITEAMGAEEINKAIGGEVFFPELAETDEDFYPDYVTVAYGTNDWSKTDREGFKIRCKKFYTALSKKYEKAKIFAITPIWRKDYQEYREYGLFEDMIQDIVEAVQGLENVTIIHGFDFVLHDSGLFADLRLHPNDAGFEHYFENLNKEIQKYI